MTYFQAELNKALEAIERVRELAEKKLDHQETTGELFDFAELVLKALDGEQS